MNQLQAFLTRLFRLENPLDKRLIWVSLALLATFGYIVISGLGDNSSSTLVDSGQGAGGAKPKQTSAITINQPQIYVHVVGAVKRAGLYRFNSGARVADAIFAADGFIASADQASINLARVLTDGEQIMVARTGQAGQLGGGSTSPGQNKLINLNHADQAAIESLPGVGPTLASRIIDWRIANGGFKTKADLQKVSGIGDKLFAKLKELVVL